MEEHFRSYRASVAKDALEGFQEFKDKSKVEKLKEAFTKAKEACESGNEQLYRGWIRKHQRLLIEIFESMVSDLDMHPLDLMQEKGHKWFKFCKTRVEFDEMVWTPRVELAEDTKKHVWDADELRLLFKVKPGQERVKEIQAKKQGRKLLSLDPLKITPLEEVNNGLVHDWTTELFDEG